MEEKDVDKYLMQHLSGNPPREGFKHHTLRDSTAELVRVQQRRSAWRRAEFAAAVLIAGIAFLGGRLSVPLTLPRSVDVTSRTTTKPDSVAVPSDLIAWLDTARLFGQLGMKDRMARAVERASRLLPIDTVITNGQTEQVFAASGSVESQKERMEPMDMPDLLLSAESLNQILARSFGD